MRLPRFRIRTIMIAVAIVGLVAGGERLHRRSEQYQRHAKLLREKTLAWEGEVENAKEPTFWKEDHLTILSRQGQLDHAMRMVSYLDGLQRKYEYASRYPWLPVEPDPPEPGTEYLNANP